jgi:ribosomal protein L11 methyltransferase
MWLSVSLPTDEEHANPLSEALMEQGALAVSIEDADAGTDAETPQFGEPGSPAAPLWQNSRVIALFEPAEDLIQRVAAAALIGGVSDLSAIRIEEVAEQDWVRLTQSQFEPIRITDTLWIVPSWHDAPNPDATNLVLDPGLAFGTGSHPTTRLCLEWLCANIKGNERLLDYGCGSGILGIAAARLGAEPVMGVDIDDNALIAARDNAENNQVTMALRHTREALEETFDVVVANILTNPLCVLAPLLAARVAPGGHIVLSGVLEAQSEEVIAAYAPYLPLHVGATFDGWVRLEGIKAGKSTS